MGGQRDDIGQEIENIQKEWEDGGGSPGRRGASPDRGEVDLNEYTGHRSAQFDFLL